MAVQCHDGKLVGVLGKADAGNIAVCIYRHVYLAGHFRLDVEGVYGHFGIYFSRFRIFVSILSRILLERGEVGGLSGKKRERVGGNIFLVEADESQHLAVGTEFQRTVEGELLFVNPVGDAVQHLVLFPVFRHLAFAVAVEQFYKEDVVVAYKSHLVAVR